MTNVVTFISATGPSGEVGVGTGGSFTSFGTVQSGTLLPLGAATHYVLFSDNFIFDGIGINFDDVTLPQNAFVSLKVDDGTNSVTLLSADATFTAVSGAAGWSWSTGLASILTAGHTVTATLTMSSTTPSIVLATPTVTGSIVELSWTATVGSSGAFTSFDVVRDDGTIVAGLDPSTTTYTDTTLQPEQAAAYQIVGHYSVVMYEPTLSNIETVCVDPFNCDCESASPYDTLANVRTRMMIRLGYPNQSSNPPPGMALIIDDALRAAQKLIYRQLVRAARRTERFYRWTMVPGQRFYGLTDSEGCCDYVLDPEKITWVGFEDLNRAWYRLDDGIPPEFYTRANINFGWPTRYEVRSCIEIFPAPQAPYTLWVKGDFGLAPLVADGDRCTIDDEAVFLLALGTLKVERGAKDASVILKQAGDYVQGIVAGTHGTKRYVPHSTTENPLTPPKFLPLGNDQA